LANQYIADKNEINAKLRLEEVKKVERVQGLYNKAQY
jgi:hypothetical protein